MQSRVRAGGPLRAGANERAMHNRALYDSLASFVEEAAWQLAEEISGGAEVPFELIEQGRASAPLYCYRPLTGRFIADRSTELMKLPSYAAAVQGLQTLPDIPAYLQVRGRRTPSPDRRSQADAALQAFLTAVWVESTDFAFDLHRVTLLLARHRCEQVFPGLGFVELSSPRSFEVDRINQKQNGLRVNLVHDLVNFSVRLITYPRIDRRRSTRVTEV